MVDSMDEIAPGITVEIRFDSFTFRDFPESEREMLQEGFRGLTNDFGSSGQPETPE